MKRFWLLLYVVSFSLISCNSEIEEIDNCGLYQTQWKGTLLYKENGTSKKCIINISFETYSKGRYICEELDSQENYSNQTTIEYEIEDNILLIFGGVHNILLGDWWVREYNGKKMILTREPNSPYEATLSIYKL